MVNCMLHVFYHNEEKLFPSSRVLSCVLHFNVEPHKLVNKVGQSVRLKQYAILPIIFYNLCERRN